MKKVLAVIGVFCIFLIHPAVRASELTYLFMPAVRQDKPQSMLVMMHGYGANEQDFNDFPVIVPGNMIVVSLRAPLPVAGDSYQWYRGSDKQKNVAADQQSSSDAVVSTVKTLQQQYHVAASHTYLGGFSQGAVMTYKVALMYPQLFHGVAVFSGHLPANFSVNSIPRHQVSQLHFFIGHGDADQRIPLAQARQAVDQLSGVTPDITFKTYPGMGHTMSLDEIKDFRQWLFSQEVQ